MKGSNTERNSSNSSAGKIPTLEVMGARVHNLKNTYPYLTELSL